MVLSRLAGAQRLRVMGRTPNLPPGSRIYAVGDVHGRLDLLDDLLAKIRDDVARRPVERALHVFLGDYIDRGCCSRDTIDRLIRYGEQNEAVFLKGNHEAIALKCLSDRTLFDQWMRLGGLETLMSYGIERQILANGRSIAELQAAFHRALPPSHIRFFRELKLSFVCGDFFFTHAGVKPDVALAQQREADLLWIRQEFLSSTEDFGKIIVHGHTPVPEVEIEPNRINIDTGAFATGRLSCLVIEDQSLSLIDTA
jgi:serine/threonine protein phosphatase 1